MVSQRMLQLGTARSVIRELFEYGRQRAAEVGAENVFDFSLGNPSVPAPAEVNETAIRLLREQADTIHCYTSAPGDTGARQRIADSLNRRFGEDCTALLQPADGHFSICSRMADTRSVFDECILIHAAPVLEIVPVTVDLFFSDSHLSVLIAIISVTFSIS